MRTEENTKREFSKSQKNEILSGTESLKKPRIENQTN
jgi:hypothetical protein